MTVDKEPKAMIKIEYYGESEDEGRTRGIHSVSLKGRTKDLIVAYIGITKTMEEQVGISKTFIKSIVKFALKKTHSKDIKYGEEMKWKK